MYEKFSIQRGPLTINGRVYLPDESEGRLPAVIISHEFGTNMLSSLRYAKPISEECAVFIFDFTCSGTGTSSGSSEDMSVFTWKEDLSAVMDYVKSLDFIDSERVNLMGCSQGGFVSTLLSAERGSEINSMVLYYPAFSIPDCVKNGSVLGTEFDPVNLPDTLEVMKLKIGRKYFEDARTIENWESLCTYGGPVLIVHGYNDIVVSVDYSRKAAGIFSGCKLIEVDSEKHFFTSPAAKTAIDETKKFLKKYNGLN